MNLYFVRHGETDYNLRRVYYGWTDCDINETGKRQAKKLQEFFQNVHFDRVITSTLKRAQNTAEIIRNGKNVPVVRLDGLREINFGSWEEKLFDEIAETDPVNCNAYWNDWKNASIPGGESLSYFYERVTKSLWECIRNFEGEDLLIVTHSGPMSVMFCNLIGVGLDGFWKFKPLQGTYSHIEVIEQCPIVLRINAPIL